MEKDKAPQYKTIYNELLKMINGGSFKPDIAIPSENELSLKYNVSRMTARKSIDMLVSEGYLGRIKGKGTFITGRKNYKKPKVSLFESLKEDNIKIKSKVLSIEMVEDPKVKIREALGLVEESVWKIVRLRHTEDDVFLLETSYIPVKLIGEINENFNENSLVEFVGKIKEVGFKTVEVEPYVLKKKEAKLLKLKKDTNVLMVNSLVKSMDQEGLIYSEGIWNNEAMPFTYKIFT